jgi:hypothetical protein
VATDLAWRLGVEVELLAPPGRSRRDLAEELARRSQGTVQRFFHPQSEPSRVKGIEIFENLTLGFKIFDGSGQEIAKCVDDLTLQRDLQRRAASKKGWYRIVSDDPRLLRLVMLHGDPERDLPEAIEPIAKLFRTPLNRGPKGMFRVADSVGAPICIAAPLPGERERPCEIITPPLDDNHEERLEGLLSPARELGFTIPAEGAVHLHFDAEPLCSATTFSNLVTTLDGRREELRAKLGTNPRCRRLGPWPPELLELVSTTEFRSLPWEEARTRVAALKPTKYRDFNIRNMALGLKSKHTFEVRILPVWTRAEPILRAAMVFERILQEAMSHQLVDDSHYRRPRLKVV